MTIQRRSFIAGILGAAMAPAIVRSGILMPVKRVWVPEGVTLTFTQEILVTAPGTYVLNLSRSMDAARLYYSQNHIPTGSLVTLDANGLLEPWTLKSQAPVFGAVQTSKLISR
jgi:hypothetical protein